MRETVDAVYRTESRRVLATLIRLLGDFDLAEEALHDAFIAALEQWPRDGVPANPRAWLVSAGRFKAIDAMRRRARFDASLGELAERLELEARDAADPAHGRRGRVEDDRLRLIFTCCHPALLARRADRADAARGLRPDDRGDRARVPRRPPTIAQRIVRAKAKIRDAGIPYQVPSRAELPERLDSVLHVIYLVFNEGYSASSGESLTRPDLSGEAIRLGRLLVELLPEPEAIGLLALMLLHESRRAARASADGEMVLLDDQDRALLEPRADRGRARAGRAGARRRGASGRTRCRRRSPRCMPRRPTADRDRLGADRRALRRAAARRAVAGGGAQPRRGGRDARRPGGRAGADRAILARGELADYHLAHSARAELCRRLGRIAEARAAYERALALTQQEPERRFLARRLTEL